MEHLRTIGLLDRNGEPFPDHIQRVLERLSLRLRREYPVLQDDVVLIDVLEEAGRRIAAREARGGPIERLHGYAWVTLSSVAKSRMRRGSIRLRQKTLDPRAGAARLSALTSDAGGAEEIEQGLLFTEILSLLSPDEQAMVLRRRGGYSTAEIAQASGRSIDAVDKVFSRIKQRVRRALGVQAPVTKSGPPKPPPSHVTGEHSRTPGDDDTETDDGTSEPTTRRRRRQVRARDRRGSK
jgi:DNA-directed RNA polymerase specialized sigma24 family protein